MGENKTAKVIFDMDGVVTGEESYWDAAALVVWELFFSPRYLGLVPRESGLAFRPDPPPEQIAAVRRRIFDGDRTVAFFKKRAVNSNWDLAFLAFSYHLVQLFRELEKREGRLPSGSEKKEAGIEDLHEMGRAMPSSAAVALNFSSVAGSWAGEARGELELMNRLTGLAPASLEELMGSMLRPHSPFWKGVQRVFQEWYFGGEKYYEIYREQPFEPAKEGLVFREKPLLPADAVKEALWKLQRQGWILGIATGRPRNELYPPLQRYGLWECFDPGSVVTFSEVEEAEEKYSGEQGRFSLRKPHPFSFLKAYFSGKKPERDMIDPPYPSLPPGRCWVVGDAMADLVAAREMGASFIGVMTGHGGRENKELFLREGADAVLDDVTGVPRFLAELNPTS